MKNNPYVERIFKLKRTKDMLQLFPNIKEWTESMGAYNAIVKHISFNFKLNDPDVTVLVVGDGSTPRTGAMIALQSNWKVFSIDPKLKKFKTKRIKEISRLTVLPIRIEELIPSLCSSCIFDKVIIVCVHSHASTFLSWTKINAKIKALINIPCCYKHDMPFKANLEYKDEFILSKKNTVQIWNTL